MHCFHIDPFRFILIHQQAHIPGFATPNAPIPIPAQLPALNQSVPQQTTSPNANQMLLQQQGQQQQQQQQQAPFGSSSKFVNQPNLVATHQKIITDNSAHDLTHATTAVIKDNEWKSNDISHVSSKLNNTSLDHHHESELKASIRYDSLLLSNIISDFSVSIFFVVSSTLCVH